MQNALSAWRQITARTVAAARVLLLCDYDGTLTPIVERPELADLPPETREVLQKIARRRRWAVGIISGRALNDLQQRVDIRGIIYAGNHGLEIEGPGISFVNPVAAEIRPMLRLFGHVLSRALGKTKGALVEDKGLTLSVHYRMVDEGKHEEVRNIFERVVGTARSVGKIRTTRGKKVYEVRPAVAWDKGKAIELLIAKHGKRPGVLPLFLGDDLTDEDGFKVVNQHNGISIFVGDEPEATAARYALQSPSEVREFLSTLLDQDLNKEKSHRLVE